MERAKRLYKRLKMGKTKYKEVQRLAEGYLSLRDQKQCIMNDFPKKTILSHEIKERIQNIEDSIEETLTKIVEKTLPFCRSIARKLLEGSFYFKNRGKFKKLSLYGYNVEVEDLVNEGYYGLFKRISNYDPESGSFSTFFKTNAGTEMFRRTIGTNLILRFPENITNELSTIIKRSSDKNEAIEKIMEKQNVDPETAEERYTAFKNNCISLDYPLNSNEDDPLKSLIEYDSTMNPHDYSEHHDLRTQLEKVMNYLNYKQKSVIEGHYIQDRTLKSIGKDSDISVSRERARQLKNEALKIIRVKIKKTDLEVYHSDE